jgi:uncharacterized protein (DUF433 family)
MAARDRVKRGVSTSPPSQTPEPASWIEKPPGVCGGDACIRRTRITVWGLVERRNLGLSDAEILEDISGLTQADLTVAWDYYAQNRDEVIRAIQENAEA